MRDRQRSLAFGMAIFRSPLSSISKLQIESEHFANKPISLEQLLAIQNRVHFVEINRSDQNS